MAKALRDFSRTNPLLVVKGGVMGSSVLSAGDAAALAEIPSREVLLARLAGLIAAPMQQFAGLLQALPRNLAYGLKALIDQQGGVPDAPAAAPEAAAPEDAAGRGRPRLPRPKPARPPRAEAARPRAEAPAPEAEAPAPEAPAPEAEAPAPGAEAPAPEAASEPEPTPADPEAASTEGAE